MKTLQTYLSESIDNGAIDHMIRARKDENGNITFYIHPHGKNGDTLDFWVSNNTLIPGQSKRNKRIMTYNEATAEWVE